MFRISIFSLVLIIAALKVSAQSPSYNSLWKKIDSLSVQRGLTKSALALVDQVYQKAKKEKNNGQLIKALISKVQFQSALTDDENDGISVLKKEILSSTGAPKAILYSLLAEAYLNYYRMNRYKIIDRVSTNGAAGEDFTTWSLNDFHNEVSKDYQLSLLPAPLLKKTSLNLYEPIIEKGNARQLRPTLFDLLAFRALTYFRNEESDITKPAYKFEIDRAAYFAPAERFIGMEIVSKDSLSVHHKALVILQQLLAFHKNDIKPDAFIDADLFRLQMLKQFGVMEDKDSLYMRGLEYIINRYPKKPAVAKVMFNLASAHAEKARQYEPLKDSSNRYEYLKAEEICNQVLAMSVENEGTSSSRELLREIRMKSVMLQTEKVNLPGHPFRSSVSYRNLNSVFLRLIRLNDEQAQRFARFYDDKIWKEISSLNTIRNWNQSLPATGDHQEHRTEIKIGELPVGAYLLLGSDAQSFDPGTNHLTAQVFHVSRISYVQNGNNFFLLDRESGMPLEKASIEFLTSKYDYNTRTNLLSRGTRLVADKNGMVRYIPAKNTGELSVFELNYQSDHLFISEQMVRSFANFGDKDEDDPVSEKEKARAYIFTDRAIYRPGQTVFFKSLLVTSEILSGHPKLITGEKSFFKIEDVNGQIIDSIQLQTNEFGSCTGQFKLPAAGLPGTFTITNSDFEGESSVQVEEYKRPKFEVELQNPGGLFRLGDSILVKGVARAFAGNNLSGAQVKFRVVRGIRFIYPWVFFKRISPNRESMEITSGTVLTNGEGGFNITFSAIPDKTVRKEDEPVFDYRIYADVTDLNGETQSTELVVSVSYKELQLQIQGLGMPEEDQRAYLKDDLKQLTISSRTINGVYVPSKLVVSFYPLKEPERLIRPRYWEEPDQFVMSRPEFLREFPNDEYQNESSYKNWLVDGNPYTVTDSSRVNDSFPIDPTRLKSGWYRVEAVTHDRYNAEIKDVRFIRILDPAGKQSGGSEYLVQANGQTILQPGNSFVTTLGSSATDIYLFRLIDSARTTANEKNPADPEIDLFRINKEVTSFKIPVTEKERGGFGISYFFVRDNRLFETTETVNVPWTNKELQISYESFRDKTQPGSMEKWKLKISGAGKDKLAAELLASMYDASLDQFEPHQWNKPEIWEDFDSRNIPDGLTNFESVSSLQKMPIPVRDKYFFDDYDRIISPPSLAGISGRLMGRVAGIAVSDNNKISFAKAKSEDGMRADTVRYVTTESLSVMSVSSGDVPKPAPIKARSDFRETAFFLPQLYTDNNGDVEFSFTMPEALTRWKLQVLAHTKDASLGYSSREVVTQKELMVQPNVTRFLREGDHLELATKVVNISAKEMTGTVHLELFDAATMQPVDGVYQNVSPNQYFTVAAGQSSVASFPIQVPFQYGRALLYRFTARTKLGNDELTDGEEAILPVLTNSILVTETMTLPMKGNASQQFNFDKLIASGNSQTLKNQALTVEFTTNPSWYALMSLPYLAENSFHCSERVFNQYYANAMAIMIANSSPKIRSVIERWKTGPQLGSSLQRNEELKSVILQETPWLAEGLSDSLQKQNLAKLFDNALMDSSQSGTLELLKKFQTTNGGFTWFDGGKDDRFITQYIITGLGHLKKLGATKSSLVLEQIMQGGIRYLDDRIAEDYANLLRLKADLKTDQASYLQIQYLYARSFFPEIAIPAKSVKAVELYKSHAGKFWVAKNKYMQGMIALIMSRNNQTVIATNILRSLKENSISSDELGTYWKDVRPGYFWYQAPVETQALLIEAFTEISKDNAFADDMKTWLLKQKQTMHWPTTKATADACYALLLRGSDWTGATRNVEVALGTKTISSSSQVTEAGTGYFKQSIPGNNVLPEMGRISVKLSSNSVPQTNAPAWGAVYWQYFERTENISSSATGVKLVKRLFIEKNSERGPVLVALKEGDAISVGDKVKVRIEIKADRDLEYVQLKDMRASSFEPVNVISGYKWAGGLGYYEATGDASTNFFFDRLRKGSYVFEYNLFAGQKGNFSNGITTIQCLYAPEFASHSEGIRVNVE